MTSSCSDGSHARLDASEPEQHGGQLLADLVVELLRDPQPLGLLSFEHPPGGLATFGLQPVEHLVEGQRELARFRGGLRAGHPLTGPGEVDPPRQRGQRLERPHHSAQQHQVDQRDERQRDRQHDRLVDRERGELAAASSTTSVTTTAATSSTAFMAATR